MARVDNLISKFMVLSKRNTTQEIASNFSTANVSAEDLISWLQG
jgi:hypothetical protein